MWRSTKKYFPVKMVKTAELPANKNYLIAAFPHGALSYGMACNVMTDANNFSEVYPGLQPYVATMNQSFFVPISRDVGLAVGKILLNLIESIMIGNGVHFFRMKKTSIRFLLFLSPIAKKTVS